MAQQAVQGVPELFIDDGAAFIFDVGEDLDFGFMHRPFDTLKSNGGTATPPVKWTLYHNLESWVETVKYAACNNASITVWYDDAINFDYSSWTYKYTPGGAEEGGGIGFGFQQVYVVTG
jgi:hypothetical protein